MWLRRWLGYAFGLAALAALILLLLTMFSARTQSTTGDSPIATPGWEATQARLGTATPPPMQASSLEPPPSSTPPSGRDFYRLQRLTTTGGAYRPAVSPDGWRIAYVSEVDGNHDIYVVDLANNIMTRLTDDPLNDMSPAWSPDGTRLAYQHNIPSSDGPVLVDYMVMNADGSNKAIMASGAHWLGNTPPAWSPSSDRIAFSDGANIIVVNVTDRREVARFTPPQGQGYFEPVWFDAESIIFTGNGVLWIGNVASGAANPIKTIDAQVYRPMVWGQDIAFVAVDDSAAHIVSGRVDGSEAREWAALPIGSIEHAAWSPTGHFIAVQADTGVYVVALWSPHNRSDLPRPLFRIDTGMPPTDLSSLAWLPDGSGFVFVAAIDGQPDLYLARLNLEAIEYFWPYATPGAPTPAPLPSPTPLPTIAPIGTLAPIGSTPDITSVSFWPDASTSLDRQSSFEFGAAITVETTLPFIAHITAFQLRPGDAVVDCTTRIVPVDQPFWANQQEFQPGQCTFASRFSYSDLAGADRLLVRVSAIEPGVNGRLWYCAQQVYQLLPSDSITATAIVTIMPAPPPPPTPSVP